MEDAWQLVWRVDGEDPRRRQQYWVEDLKSPKSCGVRKVTVGHEDWHGGRMYVCLDVDRAKNPVESRSRDLEGKSVVWG